MILEKDYVLGLDVSTSTIGVTLMDTNGKLIEITHISFPKSSPKNGDITIFNKADIFKTDISVYKNFNITNIYIEEPLKNGPNINTTILLAKFNGIVSQILWEMYNVEPEYISVYDSRKIFFPEFIVLKKIKNKKTKLTSMEEVLSFPTDADKKQLVFNKVSWLEPQVQWVLNKYMLIKQENYDRADSYVVALSSLIKSGQVKNIEKYEKLLHK